MFITLEDEIGVANLVVWAQVFEAHRRIVLGAGMIGVQGRIQREGEVVHFVIHQIEDPSQDLASVGSRGEPFPLQQGRGDEGRNGVAGGDVGEVALAGPLPREIYVRDLHLDALRVKGRNFGDC